jgi:hypothetical protein
MSVKKNISVELEAVEVILSKCAKKLFLLKDFDGAGILSLQLNFVTLNEMTETIKDQVLSGELKGNYTDQIRFLKDLERQSQEVLRTTEMAVDDLLGPAAGLKIGAVASHNDLNAFIDPGL